ncbi:MAG: UbiX family flavin prenyltransferase [Desulfotomaculaceae bacterium]|nr:UbiX family flavin prenyltransferase [Desulfotomaculaceae bacterium]
MKRIIVGMSGATGQIYGIKLMQHLRSIPDVEIHLIMSEWAKKTLLLETDWTVEKVEQLADQVHPIYDMAASVSSGSFPREGMVVIPCSVKTLSAIAHSYNDNLIVRTADVTLKERKNLILAFRETPLHRGHIRLMSEVSEAGAIITPPVPAFYNNPRSLDDIIDQTVFRIIDLLGLPSEHSRWEGPLFTVIK